IISSTTTATMFSHRCQALTVFAICLLARTAVYSIRRCGQDLCRDDQICCAQANNTVALTCCRQVVDNAYYNIAMITRKLSGVLIMLLLFAAGYFVHRLLCSRSRQRTPPSNGQPTVTASQELLVESCTPDSSVDAAPRLPTYDEYVLPVPSHVNHFHIEADGGDGADAHVVFQFVEQSGFSSVVQTQKEDSDFWLRCTMSHSDEK
uniref:Uncharacterized protein n=1 Tax=Acanthochromis polyacanthus TaxID=80966 RepID=A0A3Q1EHD4_9TELE